MKNSEFIIEKIKISNPDKILYNKSKITKEEVVKYYQKIYPKMKPFLDNRIISTIRCPDGVNSSCFFKKHLITRNKGIGRMDILNKDGEKEDYYYIKNISGFISEVQMDTIEFHIWGSTVKTLNKPDIIVFDLDPDEGMNLEKIREGVRDLKSILDALSLKSFLKTSGGKGYHIVVPIKPSASWRKIREFTKNIAIVMERKWPDKYVSNVRKINRKNKIFVDWIRNIKGATSVAPYSLRAKENASVSMPITWKELDLITPNEITMDEAIKRIQKKDPWSDFFEVEQEIK